MGRRVGRLWPIAAIAAITAGAGLLLYAVWRSPHRNDLIAYWGLVATVVTIATGWISLAWRTRAKTSADSVEGPAADHVADVLARAVTGQWMRAAADRGLLVPEPIPVRWRRPSVPLAGPAAAAAGARRFQPLPGLLAATSAQLAEGDIRDLHQLYGGLGSGRLVIAGAPGSGKSGAAVLLILAALGHRDHVAEADRPGVPVPGMFTLHGWDPNAQAVQDWLADRLGQTYPMLAGRAGAAKAAGLLASGKIAVILDGLDEIPAELRPAALRALSQQAAFRLVILTRTDEMVAAAARGHLEGAAAIELQDVDAATAAGYLTSVQLDPPPPGWKKLTKRLLRAPDSPLAAALGSPLTLTLVRDTYRDRDGVLEFLDFCDSAGCNVSRDDIVDHLLDRVLPAAYAQQPGHPPPRYGLQAAHKTLSQVAARMNQEGTRDLRWWHIPRWVPAAPRILVSALALALAVGVTYWLSLALSSPMQPPGPGEGFAAGLGFGAVLGAGPGIVFWFTVRRGRGIPLRIGPVRWHGLFRREVLRRGVGRGLGAGLLIGAVVGLTTTINNGVAAGVSAGLGAGAVAGLVFMFSRPGADEASSMIPLTSWRNDRAFGLMVGLVVGLGVGLGLGLGSSSGLGLGAGLRYGLGVGFGAGLAAGLVFMLFTTKTWTAAVAFVQLAVRWHSPVRLMRFLEDARQRHVLRIVGPVYQFRHARLQDRLAEQARPTVGSLPAAKLDAARSMPGDR